MSTTGQFDRGQHNRFQQIDGGAPMRFEYWFGIVHYVNNVEYPWISITSLLHQNDAGVSSDQVAPGRSRSSTSFDTSRSTGSAKPQIMAIESRLVTRGSPSFRAPMPAPPR